ncbi:MAG: FAD-binding oxidoreductase [Synergistetes bacterium]|nr:FAD-binding oxidoreductase [Synergistota bacterium]MCX8128284.1 FAD-binding oxidoreductase [Synergistota bacterium]MDW8192597.1 FAD-binding oxidoreductase [Synergistota bacterium]
MRKSADVVIIGGGIQGCAIAYNLAKMGCKNVVILERNTIASGSTGRCAAGIRAQWGTEMNCRLGIASIEIFENLSEELGRDIDLHQGGYLIIAYKESEFEQLKKNVKLQNSLGIKSKIISEEEAKELCPLLNTEGVVGFTFHQRDGHADPLLTTFAYAEAARRLGVEICSFTEAIGIDVRNGKIRGVITNKGYISTKVVVNCAGPYAKEVAAMVGVDIPIYPERHEILVTEPIERVSKPMLMSFSGNFYVQQRPHGSFIMGYGPKEHLRSHALNSTWGFLEEMAKKFVRLLPALSGLRVVRQWAGSYEMSPDAQPILGGIDEIEGFYISAGFSGHGFMFGPITGKVLAELILNGESSIPVEMLNYRRFERGNLIKEPAVV